MSGNFTSTMPGPSAYMIAVANGFVGTEQEWLDSLQVSVLATRTFN